MPGSKPSGSQTVTQQTQVPAYIEAAQQNLIDTANRLTSPFLQNAPSQTVAGFSPDQMTGFDLSRSMAQDASNSSLPAVPNTPVSPVTPQYAMQPTTYNPAIISNVENPAAARSDPASLVNPAFAGYANQAGAANAGAASQTGAANAGAASLTNPLFGQVSGANISALLNPFTNDVLNPTLDAMRRQLGITQAQIGARNASSAAFGGSRGALQSSEANRAFGDQVALTTGNLMAQGYDKATATALANAQNAQQSGEFNAGATNQMGQYNASNQQQAGIANQSANNQMSQYNAGLAQQTGLANQAATNQMGQYNAGLTQQASLANQGALNASAEANAARDQQALLANAAAINAARSQNVNLTNQSNAFNAGAANNMNQYNAQLAQQANLANANISENSANRALTAAGLQDTFLNDQQRRQAAALQQLLGTGQQQQQLAQQNLNQPFDIMKVLGSATPMSNFGGSGSTTTPTTSNPIGSLLGLTMAGNGLFGSSGLFPGALSGIFGGGATDLSALGALAAPTAADSALAAPGFLSSIGIFSDERDKTDIQKLGTDGKTGLPIYAYRYKSAAKNTPKVVGPMAQDVEKQYPGAVREIGGHKIIDGGALPAIFGG